MTKDRYTRHHAALRTTYSEDENHIENRVTISEFCVVVDLAIAKQYCACRKNTANSSPSPLTSVSKRGRWNFAPHRRMDRNRKRIGPADSRTSWAFALRMIARLPAAVRALLATGFTWPRVQRCFLTCSNQVLKGRTAIVVN